MTEAQMLLLVGELATRNVAPRLSLVAGQWEAQADIPAGVNIATLQAALDAKPGLAGVTAKALQVKFS